MSGTKKGSVSWDNTVQTNNQTSDLYGGKDAV